VIEISSDEDEGEEPEDDSDEGVVRVDLSPRVRTSGYAGDRLAGGGRLRRERR